MGRRFLVLSASMGSGHDTVASELVSRLVHAGHEADVVDVLDLLPARAGQALRVFYHGVIEYAPAVYAGIYAAFFRDGPVPRPTSTPLAVLAGRRLREVVATRRADVVVSVFHLGAQVAGSLRERGGLPVPSAVVMTEFAAHRQWLHAGNDLYLCHEEGVADVIRRSIGTPAVASGPLVAPRFASPPAPGSVERWRRRLGTDGCAVLLSAGAWGIGSQLAATSRLLGEAGYLPVVLCGRNERLRRKLESSSRGVALGWVDDMPGLMATGRVLVDNAAGQTALEALAAGLPVIGYRPIPGHGAAGVRRMADLGLSDYPPDAGSLLRSVRALAVPGPLRERRLRAGGKLIFSGDGISALERLGG